MSEPASALFSAELPCEGERTLGAWRAAWVFRPYAGETPGGDMFRVAPDGEGALCFALADAAGHGAMGAAFWARHGGFFAERWEALLAGGALEALVDPLDARLAASGEGDDTLCLTLGRWQPGGRLEVATCGYGTHALIRTARGPWWAEIEQLFGLKLGWLGPERRKALPRAFVRNVLEGVDRVILLSDGLLEDDHRDPNATLAGLAATNRSCAALQFEHVLASVVAAAPTPAEDDLSVIVLEKA